MFAIGNTLPVTADVFYGQSLHKKESFAFNLPFCFDILNSRCIDITVNKILSIIIENTRVQRKLTGGALLTLLLKTVGLHITAANNPAIMKTLYMIILPLSQPLQGSNFSDFDRCFI